MSLRLTASSPGACPAATDRNTRSAAMMASCSRPAASQPHPRGSGSQQRCRATAAATRRQASMQQFPEAGPALDIPSEQLPPVAEEANLATAPQASDAGLEPMWEGWDLAGDFPDPRLGDAGQAYTHIPMFGCNFYVATGQDGRMWLHDIMVQEGESDNVSRPAVLSELPKHPALYQQVPWVREKHGDYMKGKEAEFEVLKVFLIRKQEGVDAGLDLRSVVTLDAEQRTVAWEAVQVSAAAAAPDAQPEELVLRIREGQLLLEHQDELPTPIDVTMQSREQAAAEAASKDFSMVEEPEPEESDVDEDEFDDIPDIPAIDFA